MPSILEAGHAATIEQVKRDHPATVIADVDSRGIEASISTTREMWTLTAYIRKAWRGAWSYGARIERPLGLLGRFRR